MYIIQLISLQLLVLFFVVCAIFNWVKMRINQSYLVAAQIHSAHLICAPVQYHVLVHGKVIQGETEEKF